MANKQFCGNYIERLVGVDRDRYESKIELCDKIDPYEVDFNSLGNNIDSLPDVTHGDIVQYLVFTTNTITMNQMKSFKSLESHNFFTSGWVQDIKSREIPSGLILVFGVVKHSYSVNEHPLKVWLVAKKDGEVVVGHCTCMAGVGEGCSHLGAVLFALEYATHKRKLVSSTSKENKWLPPSMREVPCTEIKEYKFISAKKKYDDLYCPYQLEKTPKSQYKKMIVRPTTDEERNDFLQKAASAGENCVIMAVLPGFNDKYVTAKKSDIPKSLKTLFKKEYTQLQLKELQEIAAEACNKINITEKEIAVIEKKTKGQSDGKNKTVWYEQRAGRITASVMRKACRTNPLKPAVSTIISICYPEEQKYISKAMKWGKDHEEAAINQYLKENATEHEDLVVVKCGLKIHSKYQFIGASPDGLILCKCHQPRLLEIKCPTVGKENGDCAGLVNGTLPRESDYYYQIQTQLMVWNINYCDFVIWHFNEPLKKITIMKDEHLQSTIIEKAGIFFKSVILPELLGKFFSSRKNTALGELNFDPKLTCTCQRQAFHPMITCSNAANCSVKTFHWECVGVKGKRKNWMCSDCTKKNTALGELNFDPKLTCTCQRQAFHPMITCSNAANCSVKTFHWECVGVKGKRKNWMCSDCTKKKKKLKIILVPQK